MGKRWNIPEGLWVSALIALCYGGPAAAAQPTSTQPAALQPADSPITLTTAIQRAQDADSAYQTAVANAGIAEAQRGIARSTLLPNVIYHNQFLYTQGSRAPATVASPTGQTTQPVRFVANNAIHEYISQGSVTETIGGASYTLFRRAAADAAASRAQLEVARRGLVVTVTSNFYTALSADAKVSVAERALDEAKRFGSMTRLRETAGEVAHADTVRADLQSQQRQRDLNDAVVAAEKAHLDVGVFLFADPTIRFTLSGSLDQVPAMPTRAEIDEQARRNNPDVRAAEAALRSANLDVTAARLAYLPDLSVNALYGIDAPQFAIHASDGTRNLGYSASATLDIPVWDWFATHNRVRQSSLRRVQARVELTVTQRRLLASLNELYREAEVSRTQLGLLDESVTTAGQLLKLSNLRYTAGEGTALEVVDAQSSLVSAQSSRADGAVRYYTALANLQTLTGSAPW